MSASPGQPETSRWLRALQGLALGQLTACAAIPLGVVPPVPLGVSNWLLFPAVSVGLWLGPRWSQRLAVGGAALVALLFAVVLFTPLGPAWHQQYVRDDGLAAADVIVVLSAGSTRDRFSPHSLDRWLYGLALLRQGYAPAIVFTGEPGHPPQQFATLAVAAMEQLRLPTDQVIAFQAATGETRINTHMEAVSLAQMAAQHGWRRVLLVTSPSHTRRAALTFERAGLQVRSVPCPATDVEPPAQARGLVRVTMFRTALREAEVTLAARWHGWL